MLARLGSTGIEDGLVGGLRGNGAVVNGPGWLGRSNAAVDPGNDRGRPRDAVIASAPGLPASAAARRRAPWASASGSAGPEPTGRDATEGLLVGVAGDSHAQPGGCVMSDRIEKDVFIAAPVERVWRALTDHEQFGAWFGVKLDGPFVVGESTYGAMTE